MTPDRDDTQAGEATGRGPEPVAWRWRLPHIKTPVWHCVEEDPGEPNAYLDVQPLYAHPPKPGEAMREKVAAIRALALPLMMQSEDRVWRRAKAIVDHADAILSLTEKG